MSRFRFKLDRINGEAKSAGTDDHKAALKRFKTI